MLGQQVFGVPKISRNQFSSHLRIREEGEGLLGNKKIQSVRKVPSVRNADKDNHSLSIPVIFNEPLSSARLEALKKQKFTAVGKKERIAKALTVLSQEPTIKLPKEVWRHIAEDPDLEDQF